MSEAEVVEILDINRARTLTAEIRQAAEVVWSLVAEAYNGRIWIPLGHGSWDDYCEAELDGGRLRLPREERRRVVGSLAEAGLPTRAIAAAIGTSEGTVRTDQEAAAAQDCAPLAEEGARRVTGRDGKSYPTRNGGPPMTEEEIVLRLRELVDGGRGRMSDIEPRLRLTREQIQAIADRHGISIRSKATTSQRAARADRVRELAAVGWSSRQIATELGIAQSTLAELARTFAIEIPADEVVGRSHRINADRVVDSLVLSLASEVAALEATGPDLSTLDPERVDEWLDSLADSLGYLQRFRKRLAKECPL